MSRPFIVTGDPNVIIDGSPAVRHGNQTVCGAALVATQMPTDTE